MNPDRNVARGPEAVDDVSNGSRVSGTSTKQPYDVNHRHLGTFGLLIFGASLVLSVLALSLIVAKGQTFDDTGTLFLETKPKLFMVGTLLSVASFTGLVLSIGTSRLRAAAFATPFIGLGLGILTASLAPGLVTSSRLKYVPSQRGLGVTRYAMPVLFSKGDHRIAPAEQRRLSEALKIFVVCGLSDVQAIGFASSIKYRRSVVELGISCDSDCRNLRLANLRAAEVGNFVENELKDFKVKVNRSFWALPDQMTGARRLVDAAGDRILPDVEPLNRRAELTWLARGCK